MAAPEEPPIGASAVSEKDCRRGLSDAFNYDKTMKRCRVARSAVLEKEITEGVYPAATMKMGHARIAAGTRKRGLVGRVGGEPTAR